MNESDWAKHIIGHYERHACAWDTQRRDAGWSDKAWHDRFIAALPNGARVLDLGCGGGSPVAVNMVAQGIQVTGVDASPTLVSLCRDRMPGQEWIVADMRSLTLGRRFDGVLAWDSYFHLDPVDQYRAFEVFAAHAAVSAVLMFNTGPARGERLGCFRGDLLYHASLDLADYRSLLARSGFDILAHVVEDRKTGGGRTVWLARSRRSVSD